MSDQQIRREVRIPAGDVTLAGTLTLPPESSSVVLFAHGSGSSRHSPRNQLVAETLHAARIGTLLFDLLTEREGRDRAKVFAVDLLAERLNQARVWLVAEQGSGGLTLGFFGASTGAAAALVAAASYERSSAAIVSRGGRPDLAGDALERVTAPTLLIVGGADYEVLELNRQALGRLRCVKQLAVVPGATHLFEEPGTLEQVATLARDWFQTYL
jgi:putative phosphoribosyl transferase